MTDREISRGVTLRVITQCEADRPRDNPGVTDHEISRSVTDREISRSVRRTDREITQV